jgi:protein HOOK3
VEQFEALRKDHAELQVKFEAQGKQLTIAKSDREYDSIQGVA